jgi:site-specific recombinase XerD
MKSKLEEYKNYLLNLKKSLVYYNFLIPLSNYLLEKNLQFETLTKEQVAQYFTDKNYKPNSIDNVIKACRDYVKFLGLPNHSISEIKQLDKVKRIPEYLTLEEIQKSVKYIATYNSRLNANQAEILLLFMFYIGVRKSEILNLKRENIDLVNCKVKIYDEKNKEEKILPFPDKIIKKLTDYFNAYPEEQNAFNITSSQINYLFRIVMSKALGKKIKPHLTRHGSGRYLLEKGVPITVVQKMFGHKSIQTTLQYLDPDQAMIDRTYRDKIG